MQLYLCQTSLPAVTSGVMFSALVSSPKRMWLWTVMPKKATAAKPVATMAKIRDCRLFMGPSSDSDRGPVGNRGVAGVDHGHRHQQQYEFPDPAEDRHQACGVHSTAPRDPFGAYCGTGWRAVQRGRRDPCCLRRVV